MSSKILYDTRDNSILRCQAEPRGSAKLPSFEALCKSARVVEDDKQYMDTIVVSGDYLTWQAQERLRVVELDGEIQVKEKPKVNITLNKIEIKSNEEFTITINIQNTLSIDNFTQVDMSINDVSFTIDIDDSQGRKDIQIEEKDTYTISCNDNRFISQPIQVEVI